MISEEQGWNEGTERLRDSCLLEGESVKGCRRSRGDLLGGQASGIWGYLPGGGVGSVVSEEKGKKARLGEGETFVYTWVCVGG